MYNQLKVFDEFIPANITFLSPQKFGFLLLGCQVFYGRAILSEGILVSKSIMSISGFKPILNHSDRMSTRPQTLLVQKRALIFWARVRLGLSKILLQARRALEISI